LLAAGAREGHLDAARELRAGIGPGVSIDEFLFRRRTRPVVRELGMMAVAEVILEAERGSNLNQFDLFNFERSLNALRTTENAWPVVVLDVLIGDKSPHEITASLFEGVSFVIFNYDRCVEHVLFHHLRLRHSIPADEARQIVQSIPMLHIYGVLGDPFDGPVPFGASSVELDAVAKRLQTYHEDITDTDRQASVSTLMGHAEKVCFLGFGFLPANFERLFPDNQIGTPQLWGTAVQCEGSRSFTLAQASPGSQFASCNPTEFLRTHGEALFDAGWSI
jgi:hypothetical protein